MDGTVSTRFGEFSKGVGGGELAPSLPLPTGGKRPPRLPGGENRPRILPTSLHTTMTALLH